ncbi:hypothetical protein HBNXHr_2326 [Halorhabdus sp. BNX81]|nr:hypothetical protein HBNXHr_2326 [Halorhabdus sp. BNX81]
MSAEHGRTEFDRRFELVKTFRVAPDARFPGCDFPAQISVIDA